jgi:cytochrome c556
MLTTNKRNVMMACNRFRTLSWVGLGLSVILATGMVSAQVKHGKSRVMKTGQFMKCVIKPNCEAIKKGLEAGPADDKAWDGLAANAAVLNEASYVLMDDGRCPDGTWADAASKTLRQGSIEVLKAIEAKDAAAAKAAFGSMTKSCGSCHDAHKEKK